MIPRRDEAYNSCPGDSSAGTSRLVKEIAYTVGNCIRSAHSSNTCNPPIFDSLCSSNRLLLGWYEGDKGEYSFKLSISAFDGGDGGDGGADAAG